MDDLDHSMNIAEKDWFNFYQDSEGCCLPQPPLAQFEGVSLSAYHKDSPQSFQEASVACNTGEENCEGAAGDTAEDEKVLICDDSAITPHKKEVTVEDISEGTKKCIVTPLQAVETDVARSLVTYVRCKDPSRVPPRQERERWFVTVNDGPVSRRIRGAPVQKKTKTKTAHNEQNKCRIKKEPENTPEIKTDNNMNTLPSENTSETKETQTLFDINEQKQRKGSLLELTELTDHGMQNNKEGTFLNLREGTLHDDPSKHKITLETLQQNNSKGTLHDDDLIHKNREETLHPNDVLQINSEGTPDEDITMQRNIEGTLHEDDLLQRNIEGTLHEDDIIQRNVKGTLHDDSVMQKSIERSLHEDDIMQINNEGTLHEVDIMQRNVEGTLHVDNIMQKNMERTLHEDDIMQRNMERTLHEDDIMQMNIEGTLHEYDIMQRNIEGTLHEYDIMQRNIEGNMYDDNIMQRNIEEGTLHEHDRMQRNIEGTLHEDDILHINNEGTLDEDNIMQRNIERTQHEDDITQRNIEGTLHEHDIMQRNIGGTLQKYVILQINNDGNLHEDKIMQKNIGRTLHEDDLMQKNIEGTLHEDDITQRNIEGTMYEVYITQRKIEGNLHEDDIMQRNVEGTLQNDTIMQKNIERSLHEDDTMQRIGEGTLQDDTIMQNNIKRTLHEDDIMQRNIEGTLHEDYITQRKIEGTLHEDDVMQRNIEGTQHEHDIMQRKIDKTLHESFHWERADSNDFSDSVEFLSLQSSGSESYLSAAESVDQGLPEDSFKNQQMVCLSSSSSSCSCQPNEVCSSENLHGRGAAISCGDQVCVGSTAPGESFSSSSREPELSVCCGSPGTQPLPEVIITQVADSPEAYARAAGHKQSVYAISAFWEEMEKLTINDILHLRTTRSPPLSETSDVPTQTSSLVDPEEHNLTHGGLTDLSDASDSDYFTQASDSKADRSSWDFSVCDFEEEYWQFLGTSRNTSPDLSCKTLEDEEEMRSEDLAGRKGPQRRMTKTKSVQNVQALKTEDLSMEAFLHNDAKSETVSGDKLGSMSTVLLHGDTLEPLTRGTMHWDPEDTFLEHSDLDILFLLRESHKWKPIPIFSCSHPTVRELTLPEWSGPFLSTDAIPPARVLSHALLRPGGPIPFHDKGSIWCRRSGQRKQGSVLMSTLEGVSAPACEEQRVLGTIQTPVRLFQQSDVCLVCIAFASWVLTSSDPDSADAWKTALLANVSALSAIQFLRQRK